MVKNGIAVEFEPEFREYHVVEWYKDVGTILHKADTQTEADEWAATYAFIEQMEITNTLFSEWD